MQLTESDQVHIDEGPQKPHDEHTPTHVHQNHHPRPHHDRPGSPGSGLNPAQRTHPVGPPRPPFYRGFGRYRQHPCPGGPQFGSHHPPHQPRHSPGDVDSTESHSESDDAPNPHPPTPPFTHTHGHMGSGGLEGIHHHAPGVPVHRG